MFERFTERAKRAVVLAQEEARLLGHAYIGTEHLLLGMMHEQYGIPARVLDSLGIKIERVREVVEEIIGRGGSEPSGHIPFTQRSKKSLDYTFRESLKLEHHSIATGHLLLGLIREGEGVAIQVLVKLGIDTEPIREKIVAALRDQFSEQPSDPSDPETMDVQRTEEAVRQHRIDLQPSGKKSVVLRIDGIQVALSDALIAGLRMAAERADGDPMEMTHIRV